MQSFEWNLNHELSINEMTSWMSNWWLVIHSLDDVLSLKRQQDIKSNHKPAYWYTQQGWNCYKVLASLFLQWSCTDLFYPYPSGLLHWHWGNHMIAPVPVKQPWRIWASKWIHKVLMINQKHQCSKTSQNCFFFLIGKNNHPYFMGLTAHVSASQRDDTIGTSFVVSPDSVEDFSFDWQPSISRYQLTDAKTKRLYSSWKILNIQVLVP